MYFCILFYYIFTVKKNTSILKNLYEWIKTKHMLDIEENKKLDLPLLFIDDEADFASVNTKAHRDDITATNKYIRQIIGLFNRSTYVAYTATPFANIFINPETTDEMYGDDLFPSDFMIRVPVPDNYLGQNFYFENQDYEEINPVVIIDDNEEMIPVKHNTKFASNSFKRSFLSLIGWIRFSSDLNSIKFNPPMTVAY